jgi:hypothetical protein
VGRSLPVTGDGEGRFHLEEVPEGELVFETRSQPRFWVRGLILEPGGDKDVVLVLDWGSEQLSGTVAASGGGPLGGARVHLFWNRQGEATGSSSYRSTVTDGAGRFSFTQLGRGQHNLSASAPGYRSFQTGVDVGGAAAVAIQLERAGK